jgi:hypothetical protein
LIHKRAPSRATLRSRLEQLAAVAVESSPLHANTKSIISIITQLHVAFNTNTNANTFLTVPTSHSPSTFHPLSHLQSQPPPQTTWLAAVASATNLPPLSLCSASASKAFYESRSKGIASSREGKLWFASASPFLFNTACEPA